MKHVWLVFFVLSVAIVSCWFSYAHGAGELSQYMKSEAEIAELCKYSIKHKISAVDGKPGCQQIYTELREMAIRYEQALGDAVREVGKTGCFESSQAACTSAVKQVNEKAATAHENLERVATQAREHAKELAGL